MTDMLREKLATLPENPGCYLFKDARGEVIYIGKAKNLRNRVRSYFTISDDGRYNYPRLIASIHDFEIILTQSEVEALATEADLIKAHNPRYNVDLKDDKSFPFLRITREPFPRVTLTRKPRTPDADYYGPFTNVRDTRNLLRTLKGILRICDCSLPLDPEKIAEGKYKLCLDYHIGRCSGPCIGKISSEDYQKSIEQFILFLHGRHDEIIDTLRSEMNELAGLLRFEEAAAVRDRLQAAIQFTERQRRIDRRPINRDVIGMVREDSYAAFSVIRIRGGRIIGNSPFHMNRARELNDKELLEAFIIRHYNLTDSLPDEILLPLNLDDPESLSSYLGTIALHKIQLSVPQRGDKKRQLENARTNAEHLLFERRQMADKRDFIPRAVKGLQEALGLPEPPMLIEAFDISNLFGTDSVASMVCFKDGKPLKSAYRTFKIKTVEGIDDFASIGEAVKRRYTRLLSEVEAVNEPPPVDTEENGRIPSRLPDLVLIDGGPGQLSRARNTLDELNLPDLVVVGLAKRLEEVYLPKEKDPLQLPRTSSALRLLQQVRDEAHRFAITRHRMLRGKRQVKSRLDDIPGIGSSRRQELLKHFGSVKRISEADPEEIARVKGMNRKIAELVLRELHSEKKNDTEMNERNS